MLSKSLRSRTEINQCADLTQLGAVVRVFAVSGNVDLELRLDSDHLVVEDDNSSPGLHVVLLSVQPEDRIQLTRDYFINVLEEHS